jgi:hypothetical protein
MAKIFWVISMCSALTLGSSAHADIQLRPAVVELFTSEGCSSCPPAELLLTELAKRPDVLALSFHVDYWDGLGWRDRFSFASATERQRRYASALKQSSIYTPQAVVDGQVDVVGSQRDALSLAVQKQRSGIDTRISVDSRIVHIEVGAGSGGAADVVLIGYLRNARTPIGRGENSGRTLDESNIVRVIRHLGSWHGAASSFSADARTLPSDITDIAVLLQIEGQGAILGATSTPIR